MLLVPWLRVPLPTSRVTLLKSTPFWSRPWTCMNRASASLMLSRPVPGLALIVNGTTARPVLRSWVVSWSTPPSRLPTKASCWKLGEPALNRRL